MSLLGRLLVFGALASCASAETNGQATPTKEVVSGAAQIRGGGIRMDVQIGRGLTTRTTKNAKVTAQPHATVSP